MMRIQLGLGPSKDEEAEIGKNMVQKTLNEASSKTGFYARMTDNSLRNIAIGRGCPFYSNNGASANHLHGHDSSLFVKKPLFDNNLETIGTIISNRYRTSVLLVYSIVVRIIVAL